MRKMKIVLKPCFCHFTKKHLTLKTSDSLHECVVKEEIFFFKQVVKPEIITSEKYII